MKLVKTKQQIAQGVTFIDKGRPIFKTSCWSWFTSKLVTVWSFNTISLFILWLKSWKICIKIWILHWNMHYDADDFRTRYDITKKELGCILIKVICSHTGYLLNGIMRTHPIKNLCSKNLGFSVPTQSATKSYYVHP